MLIAASVMNSVSAWPGTSMMKTWLIRRAGAQPGRGRGHRAHQFVGVQAALHQQLAFAFVDQLRRPWPPPRRCAARRRSRTRRCRARCSLATALIFAAGPTRIGMIRPASAASSAPRSEVSSQGCTTMVDRRRASACAAAIRRSYFDWLMLSARSPRTLRNLLRIVGSRRYGLARRLELAASDAGAACQDRRSVRARSQALGRSCRSQLAEASSTSRSALQGGAASRPSSFGSSAGMAASAASSSISSMKYCSRTSALNSGSVSWRPVVDARAQPADRLETALVGAPTRHADDRAGRAPGTSRKPARVDLRLSARRSALRTSCSCSWLFAALRGWRSAPDRSRVPPAAPASRRSTWNVALRRTSRSCLRQASSPSTICSRHLFLQAPGTDCRRRPACGLSRTCSATA